MRSVDVLTRSFAVTRVGIGELRFDPRMPRELSGPGFRVRCRSQRVDVELDGTRNRVVVAVDRTVD